MRALSSASPLLFVRAHTFTSAFFSRSPITPDECPEGMADSFSSRQFTDPADLSHPPPQPPPEPSSSQPLIPEPDYDLSDNEGGFASASCNHHVPREGSQTMGRKKKKSVSFAPTDEVAKIGSGKGGRESRPESILKDPAR